MGNEYRLVKYKGEYILSTINAEKADDSFLSDDNPKCFYKPVSLDDLSDIYDYKLYADCYSGVPGVSCEWDSDGFEKLSPFLSTFEKTVTVFGSKWRCYKIRELVNVCEKEFRENANVAHCGDPRCERCNDAAKGGPIWF